MLTCFSPSGIKHVCQVFSGQKKFCQHEFSTFSTLHFLSAFSLHSPGALSPYIDPYFSVSPIAVTVKGYASWAFWSTLKHPYYFHLFKSFSSGEHFHFKITCCVYPEKSLPHATFIEIVKKINKKKIKSKTHQNWYSNLRGVETMQDI